ncbi:MAG: hypothetical protein KUG83_07580 [Gammaproteobacteria bacterium]|nr:hypothetical protein [Gammaproteobacteria bacterium]
MADLKRHHPVRVRNDTLFQAFNRAASTGLFDFEYSEMKFRQLRKEAQGGNETNTEQCITAISKDTFFTQ